MQLLDHLFVVKSLETHDDYTLKASLLPEEDHPIYQVHFPDHPVTPGVCLLQVVVELLQRAYGEDLQLCVVTNAKYLAPLIPSEGHVVEYEVRFDPVGLTTQAVVSDSEHVYAKFSLALGHTRSKPAERSEP